jgi:hypothetical protein
MSLDRKDLRFKIAPEAHERLAAIADFHDKDIGEYAAFLLERTLLGEGHAISLLADRAARWGKSGKPGDSPGFAGKPVRAVK